MRRQERGEVTSRDVETLERPCIILHIFDTQIHIHTDTETHIHTHIHRNTQTHRHTHTHLRCVPVQRKRQNNPEYSGTPGAGGGLCPEVWTPSL